MRFPVDANILVHAASCDWREHDAARAALKRWLTGNIAGAITKGMAFGLMRVVDSC